VCTCAQHCWQVEFVACCAHVVSVGPLAAPLELPEPLEPVLPLPELTPLLLLPELLPVFVIGPPPVPVEPLEQPLPYAAIESTQTVTKPDALMNFTSFPPYEAPFPENGAVRLGQEECQLTSPQAAAGRVHNRAPESTRGCLFGNGLARDEA